MKNFSFSQLVRPFLQRSQEALVSGASYMQHLLMKAAVATSLRLCIFAVRTLLNSAPNRQASRSFQS